MSSTTNSLMKLTLSEARQLFSDTAYESFIKALGRPRRAHDCHVIAKPPTEQRVLTCRLLGTDRYIPFSKVATRNKPYRFMSQLKWTALTPGRLVAATTNVDSDSQYPVDIHYDTVSTEKQNVVTVGDMVDMLSVYATADVSLLDCVRLYLLQNPHLPYFTTNHFVEGSGMNIDFLQQLQDLVQRANSRSFGFPEEGVQTNTFFRTMYRGNMLTALDTRWIPLKATSIIEKYLKDIKKMARRGRMPEAVLLGCLKELCVYLHPFTPDTASKFWEALQQPDVKRNQGLSEQPWPTDLSALNRTLYTTFCLEDGCTFETKSFFLDATDISSFTAYSAKSLICDSKFYRDRFRRENRIKDICLTPGKHGFGYNAKITLHPSK